MPDNVINVFPLGGSPSGTVTERLLNIGLVGQLEDGSACVPPREMQGQDFDGTWGGFKRERVTSCMPVLTTDHAFIHEGIAYTLAGTATVAADYYIVITTPASGYVHFKPAGIASNGGPVTVTLIEGAVVTSAGTGITPHNRNRLIVDPDSSTVLCSGGVTCSGGTTIATLYIPASTTGTQRLGASTSQAEEFVLAQDTVYALHFNETATGDVTVGYDIFWYEETSA